MHTAREPAWLGLDEDSTAAASKVGCKDNTGSAAAIAAGLVR